jgi:hypothetical protein
MNARPAASAALIVNPIRSGPRTAIAAALLALALAGVAADHAHAMRRQPAWDDECGVPGRAVGSSNDWEFYSRGESITVNGHQYVCGAFGEWRS